MIKSDNFTRGNREKSNIATYTNKYCVPKTGFKRKFSRFLMYKYK